VTAQRAALDGAQVFYPALLEAMLVSSIRRRPKSPRALRSAEKRSALHSM